MEWLQLPQPGPGSFFFLVYFLGFVGGYCFGRAHAGWITLRNYIKAQK